MRKLVERFKWLQLLFGFILIALGVLTIVIAVKAGDNYEQTIFIVWASVLFLIAFMLILFDLIAFNTKAEFSALIAAGICIGIGVFVLVNREFISQVVKTLLPYILVSIGGVLLLKTIILAVRKVAFKQWLLPFILGVIFLASGIVFLCVKDLYNVIYIALGILFIVLGAVEIIGFVTVLVNSRETSNVPTQQGNTRKKGKKKRGKGNDTDVDVVDPPVEQEVVDGTPKQIEQEDDIKLIK